MSGPPDFVARAAWLVVAGGAAAAVTARLVGWARARGVLDIPNDRSSHTRATPRGGGLAIVAVTAAAALVAALRWPAAWTPLAGWIVPGLAIAAVSWLDDCRPLRNRVRFGVHLAAAASATAVLGPIRTLELGGLGTLDLGAAAWPLTVLWIVGMTNAFNFMDGIDGIAGVTAAVAGVTVAVAAGGAGLEPVGAVSLAFAGSALGFLWCNWPPARIFMGDVGSAFCGFVIATLPLLPGPAAAARLVPVTALAMWPFIFDTAFTIGRRLRRRENVFQAHRSHLYQRLVIAGWPHRAVTILYGGLSALAAAAALAAARGAPGAVPAAILAAVALAGGMVLLTALVHRAERNRCREPART